MDVLQTVWNAISNFTVQYVANPIRSMGVWDVVDLLVLAVVLYQVYRFTRNRRAGRVLFGLGAVFVCCLIILALKLPALSYIVRLLSATAFFCIVVIFQPEIRDMLEHFANITVLNPRSNTVSRKKFALAKSVVDETVDAVEKMAATKTGALIVFEGLTKLGDYIETGKEIDARVTSKMLQTIFYENTPLHDGALIVRNMRLWAANCVLPSSKSKMDFGTMGMRHRAAVGVTEVSDALVVVISEQTGTVSVAQDGKLLRGLDADTLRDVLMTYIAGNAYLRLKRANMKKEYLAMLEKVAKVDLPKSKSTQEQSVEKEFQKIIGTDKSVTEEETESDAPSVRAGKESQAEKAQTESNDSEL